MKKLMTWTILAAAILLVAGPALAGDGSHAKPRELRYFALNGEDPNIFFHSGEHGFGLDALLGKGYLGVGLTHLTKELRAHFAESEDAGVMINQIAEGSPAAAADLRVGDVITEIDGESVGSAAALTMQVRKRDPDQTITLEIFRNGRRQLIDVTLAERERATLDVAPNLRWSRSGDDGNGPLVIELNEDGLQRFPEGLFDEEKRQALQERLKSIDWTTMTNRFTTPNEDLDERLKVLEERIQKLTEELARAYEKNNR